MPSKQDRGGASRSKAAVIDRRLVKALDHPLRAQVLGILNERDASPSEIAEELGVPIGNVSYHVKTLLDLECIELVDTRPARGALEHFYRATTPSLPSASEWSRLPASLKPLLSTTLLEEMLGDAVAAIEAGSFDARAERRFDRFSCRVDEEGWIEVTKAIEATLEWVADIERESEERRAKSGGQGIEVKVEMLAYEAAESVDLGTRHPVAGD